MTTLMPILRGNGLFGLPMNTAFDRFFEEFAKGTPFIEKSEWLPSIDITEDDKGVLLRVEVPGIDKKDIDITASGGLLTIKGEKKKDLEEKDACCHRVESHYGSFQRTLRLPEDVESDKIDASYKDGVLRITIPKAAKAEPKKIEVK